MFGEQDELNLVVQDIQWIMSIKVEEEEDWKMVSFVYEFLI